MNTILYQDLTGKIIKCFFTVYNTLGFGFLEKVYEKALMIELHKTGINAGNQKPIKVYYNKEIVGEYFVDILAEEAIIIELKAAKCLIEDHELQLVNYLKATDKEIGLLLNFGIKPEFKRKIFTNDKKGIAYR
jgi:GxxExxY protein